MKLLKQAYIVVGIFALGVTAYFHVQQQGFPWGFFWGVAIGTALGLLVGVVRGVRSILQARRNNRVA